ncbi:LexA family transcriptional regulator [Treponema socranskii]|uniref:LexA family transcriptional regulator n=1 Tax=Treponema socranskii TaxID=53419 RepID=UPI003D927438
MDIAEEIRNIRRKTGKTQKEFAELLNIPQTTWASYEAGKANPPLKILIRLAEMGYPIKRLTTGVVSDMKDAGIISDAEIKERQAKLGGFPVDMNIKDLPPITKIIDNGGFVIPVLDQSLSAGKGQLLPDSDVSTGYIAVPKELKRYGNNLTALYVNGDSMEPTLQRGDLIVCDSCGWDGEGIYALRMDGCGYVKRLARKPGKIVVISDNPKYEAWEEPAESQAIDIIGRVHYTFKHVD